MLISALNARITPTVTMSKKPKPNKEPANLSLPRWLKAASEKKAAERGYSLSDQVSRLLENWVDEESARPGKNLPPLAKKP